MQWGSRHPLALRQRLRRSSGSGTRKDPASMTSSTRLTLPSGQTRWTCTLSSPGSTTTGNFALNTINTSLLTPYGLRSLAPSDKNYQGRYTGDRSYHNGCVWPWRITAYYVEALLRNGIPRKRLRQMLVPVLQHLREAGVGYISGDL